MSAAHQRRDHLPSTPAVTLGRLPAPHRPTAVGPDTGGVVFNLFYTHSPIEQYVKDGRYADRDCHERPTRPWMPGRLPNLEALQLSNLEAFQAHN